MKRSHTYAGGLVLTLLVIGAATGVFLRDRSLVSGAPAGGGEATGMPLPLEQMTSQPLEALPDGTMRYTNRQYRFSLAYPQELTVQEYAENGGGRTIIFETPDMKKGFQVFIMPYSGAQVSPERFRMDVPSGVRKEPTDVIIDGTTATMFFSENMVMGETREVWFIKNGFLYEVTTYKPLDQWLGTVMRSWKFL